MNVNLNVFSKAEMILACRALGMKTGDTGKNSKAVYTEMLTTFPDATAVESALSSVSPKANSGLTLSVAQVPNLVSYTAPPVVSAKVVRTETAAKVFGIKSGWAKSRMVDVWDDPGAPAINPTFRFNSDDLLVALGAIEKGENLWLSGPKGTGKTEFVKQLCARLGRAFFRVNFDASTEKYEVLGGERVKAGSTVWQDGVILMGCRRPGAIILLDEICRARPEYLIALNPILEPRATVTVAETGECVPVAEGVVFIAADNTNGRGDPTGVYVAREMDGSTVDRFARMIEFEYFDAETEAGIVVDNTGCHVDLAREIVKYFAVARTCAVGGTVSDPPGLRQAMALASTLCDGVSVKKAFAVCLFNKADPASKEELMSLYATHVDAARYEAALEGRLDQYLIDVAAKVDAAKAANAAAMPTAA